MARGNRVPSDRVEDVTRGGAEAVAATTALPGEGTS
jgi:hypothetical protein